MCKQKRWNRKLSAFPKARRRARRGAGGWFLMRWSNKLLFAVRWWSARVLVVWNRDGSRSWSLDLRSCPDFSSSPKQAILPKSVSLAACTLRVVQTSLSGVRSHEVGDNLALHVNCMPAIKHLLNCLNCNPSSWMQQLRYVGLPVWASGHSYKCLTNYWDVCDHLMSQDGKLAAFHLKSGPFWHW